MLRSGSQFTVQTSRYFNQYYIRDLGQGHRKITQYISPDQYLLIPEYQMTRVKIIYGNYLSPTAISIDFNSDIAVLWTKKVVVFIIYTESITVKHCLLGDCQYPIRMVESPSQHSMQGVVCRVRIAQDLHPGIGFPSIYGRCHFTTPSQQDEYTHWPDHDVLSVSLDCAWSPYTPEDILPNSAI